MHQAGQSSSLPENVWQENCPRVSTNKLLLAPAVLEENVAMDHNLMLEPDAQPFSGRHQAPLPCCYPVLRARVQTFSQICLTNGYVHKCRLGVYTEHRSLQGSTIFGVGTATDS